VTIHIEKKYATKAIVHINKISNEKFISFLEEDQYEEDQYYDRKHIVHFGHQQDTPLTGDYFTIKDSQYTCGGRVKYEGQVRVNIIDGEIILKNLENESQVEPRTKIIEFNQSYREIKSNRWERINLDELRLS
jgi:hypothetical protein